MRFDRIRPVGQRSIREKYSYDDHEPYNEYDDDVSIDFIDDSPKSTIKQSTDDKLNIIYKKLEIIENYLKQLVGNNQPVNESAISAMDRLPKGAQQILDEPFAMPQIPHPASKALFTASKNSPTLYAPQNVRPQGSILEEIQQVLTAQDVMDTKPDQNVVNTACSPNIGYDDNIDGIDIDNINI